MTEKIYIIPPSDCPALPEKSIGGASPCKNYNFSFTVQEQQIEQVPVTTGTVTMACIQAVPDTDSDGNTPVLEIVVPPGHNIAMHVVWDLAPACPPFSVSRVASCKSDCCSTQELEYCWPKNGTNSILSPGRYRVRTHPQNMCLDESTIGAKVNALVWLEPIDHEYLRALSAISNAGCGCSGYAKILEN